MNIHSIKLNKLYNKERSDNGNFTIIVLQEHIQGGPSQNVFYIFYSHHGPLRQTYGELHAWQ